MAIPPKALKMCIACDQSILVLRIYLRDTVRCTDIYRYEEKTGNNVGDHKWDWLNKTVLG